MQTKSENIPVDSPQTGEALRQNLSTFDRHAGNWLTSHLSRYIQYMKGRGKGDLYALVLRGVEKPLIEIVLGETRGNQGQAAQMLGMNRNTLRRKIKALGIKIKRKSA